MLASACSTLETVVKKEKLFHFGLNNVFEEVKWE